MLLRLIIFITIIWIIIFVIKKIIIIYQNSSIDELEEKYDKTKRIRRSLEKIKNKLKTN